MKKLYALLLTAVLVTTLAMPIVAAPSPAAAVTAVSEIQTTVAGVTIAASAKEVIDEVILNIASKPEVLAAYGIDASAKLASVVEVNFTGPIPEGGVQIPFIVNNAKAGDLVVALHKKADGTWEKVGQAILGADKTLIGTFTSFSPVAFFVVDAANVAATLNVAAGVKAPKTGEY